MRLIRAVLGDAALRERLLQAQRERGGSRGAGRMVDECLELYADIRRRAGPRRPNPVAALAVGRNIGSPPWS